MDVALPVDHGMSTKRNKTTTNKIDKYLDLARELKILLSINMTVIPLVFGVVVIVLKDLERNIDGSGVVRKEQELTGYSIVWISIKENRIGLVLWHINHCRLFNAKYIYIYP